MNANEVIALIGKGESETLEFKRNFDKAAMETITAFANSKGGVVLVGVEDDGKINGRVVGKETMQNWINQVKQATSPSIIPDVEAVALQKKQVVVLRVKEYPIKPVSFKGRYLKRQKNSNHHMDIGEVTELHLKTFHTSWDYYPDDHHSLDDISLDKVAHFIELSNKYRGNKITDDPLRVLNKYQLIRDGKITYGGYLLFAKDYSPLAAIELGHFQTPTIIKDGETLKCDLISEVEAAMGFIKKHINKAYIFTGAIQREERWDYPLEAVREIVVNSIIHRDYRSASDSVIKIFNDRIQFYNPGKLPEGLTVEKLLTGDYVSTVRNKKIAEIFREAGIIEKYGSGIGRIREEFEKYGLPQPLFEEMGNGFMVTIFKRLESQGVVEYHVRDLSGYVEEKHGGFYGEPIGDTLEDTERDTKKDTKGISEKDTKGSVKKADKRDERNVNNGGAKRDTRKDTKGYSDRDTKKDTMEVREKESLILSEIEDDPFITAEALAAIIGINVRNTKKYLAGLKEKGLIVRVGGRRYGKWQVTRKG